MKKQIKHITFYIVWLAILYVLLYVVYKITSNFNTKAKMLFDTKYSLYSVITQIVFFILIGVLIGILVFYRNNLLNLKESLTEFIIIGINGILMSSFYIIKWFNIDVFFPRWVFEYNDKLCIIGCLLFGYELFSFIKEYKNNRE